MKNYKKNHRNSKNTGQSNKEEFDLKKSLGKPKKTESEF